MYDKLGPFGIAGVLALAGGIGLLAWYDLVVGAGVALVVAGLGLFVYGIVQNLMRAMGMGGMV